MDKLGKDIGGAMQGKETREKTLVQGGGSLGWVKDIPMLNKR